MANGGEWEGEGEWANENGLTGEHCLSRALSSRWACHTCRCKTYDTAPGDVMQLECGVAGWVAGVRGREMRGEVDGR